MAKKSMFEIKQKFLNHLNVQYPLLFEKADSEKIKNLISDQLLSPHVLQLPVSVLEEIKKQVFQLYQLRTFSEQNLGAKFLNYELPKSNLKSVCTSYDFHLTPQQELKLIEVNTNAAFLAMGLELYETWNKSTATGFNKDSLVKMFETELEGAQLSKKHLAILDEKPQEQRLFIEFLIYQQLLQKKGWSCEIIDLPDLAQIVEPTLIYNRYTDFYLESENSKALKNLYQNNVLQLSPSPWEYFLLADKQRMLDWQMQSDFLVPSSLLKIIDLTTASPEEVWAQRKNLFFKPKNSFGSKQAYKGASLSKKVFEEAIAQGFIAQEFAPASEIEVMQNNQSEKFKFDLRCYAYGSELQCVIARLYQGQTTNLKTIGGGFTVIDWLPNL